MKVELDKYIVEDIPRILFEDRDTYTVKMREGYRLDWQSLSKKDVRYLAVLLCEVYQQGGLRVVEQINDDDERQRKKAQEKALRKILKGNY